MPGGKYFFTHELGANAFSAVASSGLLLAGSLTKMAKESSGSDITRSHINPVFTRVLSLEKTGNMKSVKRLAIRENLVGADSSIVIIINSNAVDRSHSRVLDYVNSHGYGKHVFAQSVEPGFYKSYEADTGKTGASSLQERTPYEIAKSSDYKYTNEQHWNLGIELKGNVAGVIIKVEKVGSTWTLARSRGTSKEAWKAGAGKSVNEAVSKAIRDARKLTDEIWLVGAGVYLEDIAEKLIKNE